MILICVEAGYWVALIPSNSPCHYTKTPIPMEGWIKHYFNLTQYISLLGGIALFITWSVNIWLITWSYWGYFGDLALSLWIIFILVLPLATSVFLQLTSLL